MTDGYPHPKFTERRRQLGRDALKNGDGDGTLPPMEQRLSRLEEAFARVDISLDRLSSDIADVKASQTRLEDRTSLIGASQARIEERMERVMDRARDMPTPDKVDSMINSKMGIAALLFAGLGALIAAITYAAG
ncbi:hypothetical protein PARHAE_00729 [Paracoccus haematequi]|uniref:Uncharacterized protein n=1 Tax=Paracoccus haematequi TaxID=2491866 RepID=A0A447IJ64_9RHOB|nr:hypothetical protein [Paracoccus haematequi]VDS07552.1 hypothetical protein PARHAE_00729 [Paracoccus haematequi]